ncbi:hypothetical protein EUX98_g8692 [Antrodiella citrinella]|uniref:Uncharacterized protein n=1 Tax=Antrodiella citrinella TaxID=2447956 RepID=A0A4S4MA92_9APHY|nr:hypothetical protein EUX98_g8692 [Antrodiella citrinella]
MSASSLASSTGSIHVAQEQWNHIMSSSLSALASQFQAASQVIASSSASVSDGAYNERSSASYSDAAPEQEEAASEVSDLALARSSVNPLGVETMLSLMMSRLENVERNQVRLSGELESVRVELAELKHSGRGFDGGEPTSVEKVTEDAGYFPRQEGKMKETEIVEVSRSDEPQQPPEAEVQKRVEALETNVLSILETLKVEQARLYPRLQNAAVTLNKQAIKPLPVQGTGKAPINFPATKGEFEHLTKERYEALLKSYGLPVKGDTAAKREAVREYIGLTQPGK